MNTVILDDVCKSLECPHYIEWEYPSYNGHGNVGYNQCISCELVGKSHNIDKVPDECPNAITVFEFIAKEGV